MSKDISVIPAGQYCYSIISTKDGKLRTASCPYWSINHNYEYQNNGYCSFLDTGDWNEVSSFGLLWDQVKLCGLNCEE